MKQELKIEEAIKQIKSGKKRNFVESIDINVQINLKVKSKNDSLKGSVSLPNKLGESKKVIAFVEESEEAAVIKAGAVEAGLEELEKKVLDGWSEFDVVLANPKVMPKIAKLGKVLGPKGLMPSPKNGTITENVEAAVKEFVAGKQNFKMEQGHGVVKANVAKVDMENSAIEENVVAFLKAVLEEAKKFGTNPFKQVTLKSTMGPSIKIDISDIIDSL